jgi:hypothetical protein
MPLGAAHTSVQKIAEIYVKKALNATPHAAPKRDKPGKARTNELDITLLA